MEHQATMPHRRLIVSTVGISLLLSHQATERREAHRQWLLNLANVTHLDPEDATAISEIVSRAKATLTSDDVGLIRRQSAELNGIYAIYEGQIARGSQDMHLLITTDTNLGRRCAALVKDHLLGHGIRVDSYTPQGLTAANSVAFEEGSKALIHWCAQQIPEYRDAGFAVVFNLVAAFKSLQGFLTTVGMFYADEIVSLFEGEDATLVKIPRLPIMIDLDALRPYVPWLAMMVAGDAVVPVTVLRDLSPALYDQDASGDAMISQWGALVWNQAAETFLTDELLTFPRLRYEETFKHDYKRASGKDRARLQNVLAKAAALLDANGGNPSVLKSDGGLQYDNYTGKQSQGNPIGHFRISQGGRVSCLATTGELRLRHFGAHDYVNGNP